ncbi:MAG: hypothetical protein QGF09_13975, partial [Rhodospirillales bacterium]|nr:hypothetical protein [Rhodospirillales bacterium]
WNVNEISNVDQIAEREGRSECGAPERKAIPGSGRSGDAPIPLGIIGDIQVGWALRAGSRVVTNVGTTDTSFKAR